MSLNWKEINLILGELDLEGAQIQGVTQSAFDVIFMRLHKKGATRQLLISLSPGACRIHETFSAFPKSDKPLRFAQFFNSRIVNGWITEAIQLDDNRIVRFVVKRGQFVYKLYIRLWSNAANFIVTDESAVVLDAMRRLPKKGEITGGSYQPEQAINIAKKKSDQTHETRVYEIRSYEIRTFSGEGSFNKKIDAFYSERKGPLSLEALREQARRSYEGSSGRICAALEKLKEKEASFSDAQRYKIFGDLILSNIALIKPEDEWLEAEDESGAVRIKLEPRTSPAAIAGKYYDQYRKAKNALGEIQREIAQGEQELRDITEKLNRLLEETNPLALAKLLRTPLQTASSPRKEKTRPGLSFKRGDWLIIVGRDSGENDELLRRHVKGNDLWLHAREYHGSYVFIKQRSGKSVPLDILLDAGNLALFYSKGRNNRKGDLFYTQVKYLRRVKDGTKGLVLPTQEKNLYIEIDEARLRSLENLRVM
jgi:predicted ribosome quality control (RQC) complex YloA/Tae2 family protein